MSNAYSGAVVDVWTSMSAMRLGLRAVIATALTFALVASMQVISLPGALAAGAPPALPHPWNIPNNGDAVAAAAKAGYLSGTGQVSPDGSFAYTIPLEVPQGRAQMQPSLSLSYFSKAGDGPLGLGWAVSGMTSMITRCGKTPRVDDTTQGVRFDENDRYCLDGQELVALSGTYGGDGAEYRTAHDVFAKVMSVNFPPVPRRDGSPGSPSTPATGPDTFIAYTKDGLIKTYVARTGSRTDESVQLTIEGAPDSNTHQITSTEHTEQHSANPTSPRIAWELSSVKDRSGNSMNYQYASWANERLPVKISYTAGQNLTAAREIRFIWEDRADKSFKFVSGVRFDSTKRLKDIEMWAPNPAATELVRVYHLTYQAARLSKVQECGALGGCLPAKQFTWASPVIPGFNTTIDLGPLETVSLEAATGTNESLFSPYVRVADVDGDGADDVIYSVGGLQQNFPDQIRLGTRNAAGAVSPLAAHYNLTDQGAWPKGNWLSSINESRPIDIDSDGKNEIAVRYTDSPGNLYGIRDKSKVVRWDPATHTFADAGIDFAGAATATDWEDYGDLDGNGYLDRITNVDVQLNSGGEQFTNFPGGLDTMLGYSNSTNTGTPEDHAGLQFKSCFRTVSDVDGDGRADILFDTQAEVPDENWSWIINPFNLGDVWFGENSNLFCHIGDGTSSLAVANDGTKTIRDGGEVHTGFVLGKGRTFPQMNTQVQGYHQSILTNKPDYFGNVDPKIETYWHQNYVLGNAPTFLGDFNGDGLQDTLMVPHSLNAAQASMFGGPAKILWNTGTGLWWNSAAPAIDVSPDDLADVRIGDLNGDGMDDIAAFEDSGLSIDRKDITSNDDDVLAHTQGTKRIRIMISNGDGTFRTQDMSGIDPGKARLDTGRQFSQLGDFNADGRLDILKNDTRRDAANNLSGSLKVLLQDQSAPDVITEVWDEGAKDSRLAVGYSHDWTDHDEVIESCSPPLRCIRRGIPVVRQMTSHTEAQPYTLYYSYADPVVHVLQGFEGFGTFRVWDPHQSTETTMTFDHKNPIDGHYALSATPKTVTQVKALAAISAESPPSRVKARITSVTNEFGYRQLNQGKSWTVFTQNTQTVESEGDVAVNLQTDPHLAVITKLPFRTTSSVSTHDDYGNVTHSATGIANGTTQTVDTTFEMTPARISAWLISLAGHSVVTSAEFDNDPPAVSRHTDNQFDDKGRLTKSVSEMGTPDEVTHTYGFDLTTGVVNTVTTYAAGQANRVTHSEYTPVFAGQPAEQIYASQTWSEHDKANYEPSMWQAIQPAFGVVVATQDLNGVSTGVSIDDLGRPLTTTGDGQAAVNTAYAPHTDAAAKMDGLIVTSLTETGAPGKMSKTVTVTDQLGRNVSSSATGYDGIDVITARSYDHVGRLAIQTRPYKAGSNPAGVSLYYYDNLGRPTETQTPDAKVETWEYPDPFTAIDHAIAPAGQTRTVNDINGRVSSRSIAYGAQQWATTTTEYGPFDLPSKVTDDAGNVTSYEYTVQGWRKKLSDPDRGTVTSTYYPTGEVKAETHSGTNNSSTFSYDDLGRKTAVTDHDGFTNADVTTTFGYDTAVHGIGKLAVATSPDGITTTSHYDALGRASGTDYSYADTGGINHTYSTSQNYDAKGRIDLFAYPDVPGRNRLTLKNTYNDYGFHTDLTDVTPFQNSKLLEHETSYSNDGMLTAATFGSVSMTNSFDPVTGRLGNIKAVNAANVKLQDLTYTYYDNGLVKTRVKNDSGAANRAEAFSYDEFSRLKSWTLNNTATSYVYNTIGNLLSTGNEIRTFVPSHPHAMDSNGTETYHYDPQGREADITDAANKTLRKTEYNAFDLPKRITDKLGKTTTFRYDALGNRVLEDGPNGTTFTFPGLFEARGNTYVYYIPGAGQLVFDGAATKTEYTFTDSLGSSSAIVDGANNLQQTLFYDPFGARTDVSGKQIASVPGDVTHGFTGHEHDDDLRLINMKGRMFDPVAKQFQTPDPVMYNHPYTYLNSSPLNATDPTGYDAFWVPGDPIDTGFNYDSYGFTYNAFPSLSTDYTGALWNMPAPAESDGIGYDAMKSNGGGTCVSDDWCDPEDMSPQLGDETFNAIGDFLDDKALFDPMGGHKNPKYFSLSDLAERAAMAQLAIDGPELLLFGVGKVEGAYGAFKELQAVRDANLARSMEETAEIVDEGFGIPGEVNPTDPSRVNGFNPLGGTKNCQECVKAGDLFLRTGEIKAAPNLRGGPRTGPGSLESFYGKSFTTSPAGSTFEIGADLEEYGEGTTAIIRGQTGDGPGHVFNARVENGRAVFYDFQRYGGAVPLDQISRYNEADSFYMMITSD